MYLHLYSIIYINAQNVWERIVLPLSCHSKLWTYTLHGTPFQFRKCTCVRSIYHRTPCTAPTNNDDSNDDDDNDADEDDDDDDTNQAIHNTKPQQQQQNKKKQRREEKREKKICIKKIECRRMPIQTIHITYTSNYTCSRRNTFEFMIFRKPFHNMYIVHTNNS